MLQRILELLGFDAPPPPPPSSIPAAPMPVPAPPRAPGSALAPRFPLQRLLRASPLSEAAAAFLVRKLCALAATGESLRDLGSPHVELNATDLLVTGKPNFRSGRHRGLFQYFSPESVRGLPPTRQSDVFVLGALLAECVTGRAPFKRDNDFATLEAVRLGALPPLPGLSAPLLRVVERACQAEPERRHASLDALAAELAPIQEAFDEPQWRAMMLAHAPSAQALPLEPPALVPLVDEPSRLVYADQLEEGGRAKEAQWLRLDAAVRVACGAEQLALINQLRALTPELDPHFLASVSRSPIDGCPVRLGFTCPWSWDRLRRTEQVNVRFCTGCQREVHFATDVEEAQHRLMQGHCVALRADLEPEREALGEHTYMGR